MSAIVTPVPHPHFWKQFLDATATDPTDAQSRFYGTLHPGDSMAGFDDSVELVLSGDKTASSALLAEYTAAGRRPPEPSALSIVLDQDGAPVAVIETLAVAIERFAEVDDAFARAHGDGQTLKSWRRHCRAACAARARALGAPFGESTELFCHRFRVVFAPESRDERHCEPAGLFEHHSSTGR